MSIYRHISHWRSARYSSAENRLVFNNGEAPDPTKRHETAINESEQHESYKDVHAEINKYRNAAKDFRENQKQSLEFAVKKHEGVLNVKLSAQLGLFQTTEEFTSADTPKKTELLQARSASLARDMAAHFNQRSLGQDVLATVIVDADGLSGLKLELKSQTPIEQKPDTPKKPEAPGEKKPVGPEQKPAPDQQQLDALRAKLGPNTQKAIAALKPGQQIVALRAIGALPADQPRIEALLADPKIAQQVPMLITSAAGLASREAKDLVSMVENKNAKDPQKDLQNAELLKRLATAIMHAQNGPIPAKVEIGKIPEPKTEGERLQRELSAAMTVILDRNASPGDRLAAALTAMSLLGDMITNFKDLKGPPKLSSAANTANAPKGAPNASMPVSTDQLKTKAAEKNKTLKEYHDQLATDVSKTKTDFDASKGKLAGAQAEERSLTERAAALEKSIAEQGDRATPESKKELAEVKGKLATAKEMVKTYSEEVKQNEKKYNEAQAEFKSLNTLVVTVNAQAKELDAAMTKMYLSFGGADFVTPDYAKSLEPFFHGSRRISIDPNTYELKLGYADANLLNKAMQAFNAFGLKAGIQPELNGIDGSGVIMSTENFSSTMQKIAQYLRTEFDEKPKRVEKAGKEYLEKVPGIQMRQEGGNTSYFVQEPGMPPSSTLYFRVGNNGWEWGQGDASGQVQYNKNAYSIVPDHSKAGQEMYKKYNTYIMELTKINEDRRS